MNTPTEQINQVAAILNAAGKLKAAFEYPGYMDVSDGRGNSFAWGIDSEEKGLWTGNDYNGENARSFVVGSPESDARTITRLTKLTRDAASLTDCFATASRFKLHLSAEVWIAYAGRFGTLAEARADAFTPAELRDRVSAILNPSRTLPAIKAHGCAFVYPRNNQRKDNTKPKRKQQ